MKKIKPTLLLPIACVLIALGAVVKAHAPIDPNALWTIVSTKCVPDEAQHGQPAPCVLVDVQKGYAILKDKRGRTQFLLIPTTRVPGIEDPALLNPQMPNYFAAAWQARSFTEDALKKKLPPQEILLAVNSAQGRTQSQLHIHIDCIARAVRNTLERHQSEITRSWMTLSVPLKGHSYQVRRIDRLGDVDPFALLAELPDARGDMGAETLAVTGAVFENGTPGFILLADKAQGSDHASSEELQDHSCTVAREGAP